MMKRHEKTTASKLLPGDRFYQCADKKKNVLAVIENKALCICCPEAHAEGQKAKTYAMFLRPGTDVIFLRSTT